VIGDKNDGGSTRHEGIAPANHRTAMDAVERYLMYFDAGTAPVGAASMLDDLADRSSRARRTGP
jgi:hypothetical protein